MARHIWQSTRFTIGTLTCAKNLAVHAHRNGLTEFDALCRYIGYVMERCRQSTTMYRDDNEHVFAGWLASCTKSKHRYARGENRDGYLKGGQLLFAGMHKLVKLDKGCDPAAVFDKILEKEEQFR